MTIRRDELIALGLLDPASPDAAERESLLALALDRGATLDEVRAAVAGKRLHAVAAERVVLGGRRITLADAAGAAGADVAFGQRIWRALGFPDVELDALVCTDADAAIFRLYSSTAATVGDEAAVRLAITTGASLARIADAAIATVRARVEAPIRAAGGRDAQVADAFVTVAEAILPLLYPMLEAVHRRHLVQAAHRYSLWESDPTVESTAHAVIGFADLVGFTALVEHVGVVELDDMLMAFEEHVRDAIQPDGARLVKLIGDEALFVAGDVEHAVAIAHTLVRAVVEDRRLPDVRVGMAAGEILVRDGDVFGPAVNRASRLVQVAEPAMIVVDDSVAGRLPADATSLVGTRELAGIDRPVVLRRLTR